MPFGSSEEAPVQFSSAEESRVTSSFGMWVFLATEIMFFVVWLAIAALLTFADYLTRVSPPSPFG